ncbi:hypothetical protein DM785_19200 (plasmid) [Deinococcus actinosclerus]|nr:hypothetical protein DM785_19200 [Deinococcus actinosclerus]
MSKNKTTPATPRPRAVYEVRPAQGRAVQVEAATPGELAAQLERTLGTDAQTSRAAAHLLHQTRAAITAPRWSARRLGVLAFVPDDDEPAAAPARPAFRPPPPRDDQHQVQSLQDPQPGD